MEIIAYCFFDITLNFLEKNMYANLLTRCDDACVITPYLFIKHILHILYFEDLILLILMVCFFLHITYRNLL